MDEPRFDELMFRLETLEKEKRRWKVIGIVSLALLALCFLGGASWVGVVALPQVKYARLLEVERDAAIQERIAAEKARQAAEEARQQAIRQMNPNFGKRGGYGKDW